MVRPLDIDWDGGGGGGGVGGPEDNKKSKAKISIGTEDIIAIFGGIVSVILALGIVLQKVPANKTSLGTLAAFGSGAAIAQVVKTRKKEK